MVVYWFECETNLMWRYNDLVAFSCVESIDVFKVLKSVDNSEVLLCVWDNKFT